MMPRMTTPTMAATATISPTSGPGSVGALPTREQARPRTDRHRLRPEPIDMLAAHVPQKGSPLSVVLFYRFDEAYSEVGEDDAAFGGGRSPYMGFFMGLAPLRRCLSRSGVGGVTVGRIATPHDGPRRRRQRPR